MPPLMRTGDPARHSIEARRVFYMDSGLLLRRMHTAADEAFSTGKRTTARGRAGRQATGDRLQEEKKAAGRPLLPRHLVTPSPLLPVQSQ